MENINLKNLYNAHELFNDYFFKGMLNGIKIRYKKRVIIGGIICYGAFYYELPRSLYISKLCNTPYLTLLHEMIHQYQYEYDIPDKNHGATFKKFARFMEITLNLKKGAI